MTAFVAVVAELSHFCSSAVWLEGFVGSSADVALLLIGISFWPVARYIHTTCMLLHVLVSLLYI